MGQTERSTSKIGGARIPMTTAPRGDEADSKDQPQSRAPSLGQSGATELVEAIRDNRPYMERLALERIYAAGRISGVDLDAEDYVRITLDVALEAIGRRVAVFEGERERLVASVMEKLK